MSVIDYNKVYDYANDKMSSTDKEGNSIEILSEEIFIIYFKENFNNQIITLKGHLRGVLDNRKMSEFENQRIWNDFKRHYIGVIEGYLLKPLATGKHNKEEIIKFFQQGEQEPHWIEDIHCVDCGCIVRVKRKVMFIPMT